MRLHVAHHPLITHGLTILRDRETSSTTFRQLVDELVTLLTCEAARKVAATETPIQTPVAPTAGLKLSEPRPIVVPVLHTDLGMFEDMTRMLPIAEVDFLGMRRGNDTLEVETYVNRLPDDLSGRQCPVLDPMLTTGHTIVAATNYLLERGAEDVTCVCILAAPEGINTLENTIDDHVDVDVVIAAVDDRLNEKSYVVPGPGDTGGRLYGIADWRGTRPLTHRSAGGYNAANATRGVGAGRKSRAHPSHLLNNKGTN